jgi:hypothetical protein
MAEHIVHNPEADLDEPLPEGFLRIVEIIISSDDEEARLLELDLARADTDGMALAPETDKE